MPKLLNSPENNFPPVPANYNPPPWYGEPSEPEEPTVPLSHYLWILRRQMWKILSFVAVCVISTGIVSSRLTPVYESTATVDVDRRMPAGIIGQDANPYPTMDADQFLATQLKLIQSDSVLRPVVEKYKLADLEPADLLTKETNATEVGEDPVKLPKLKVTRPPNTYLLLISYRSPDPHLASNVANAVAASYIQHTFDIRFRSSASLASFMEKQIEELRAKMERSSTALAQFERELNVINPEEKTSILSSRLLQLNTEYTNSQTDRVKKEAALNSVNSGSLESLQVSAQGEALKKLAEGRDEAQAKMAQVAAQYGKRHPEYQKAATQVATLQSQFESARLNIARRVETEYKEATNREAMLKTAVAETKTEFDKLNARSFEYKALKQEAEADKKLYQELTTRIKEAGINAGFQNSAIRMADPARPARRPVFPNMTMNLGLALLFSSLLAVAAAVLNDSLDSTVRDPEQVRRTLSTEVIGSLPLIKGMRKRPILLLPAGENKAAGEALAPSKRSNYRYYVSSFDEAVRTLRNAVLLANLDQPLKSIMLTSASPAEGKTTTAVHLAVAHAQQKLKTLLVDGDLRRPGVHGILGLPNETGFSSALANGMDWKAQLVQLPNLPDLDILTAGPASRRGAEMVGRGVEQILAEAVGKYSLVIVDSPPVVGFPEPLQMAVAVDGVVLITLAGQTHRKAIGSAIDVLKRLHANVVGLVLNEVTSSLSDNYYYYGHYGKYYKYYKHYHSNGQQ